MTNEIVDQNAAVDIPALAAQLATFPTDIRGPAHRLARLSRAELMVLVGHVAAEPNGRRTLNRLNDVCTYALYGSDE